MPLSVPRVIKKKRDVQKYMVRKEKDEKGTFQIKILSSYAMVKSTFNV